MKPYQWIVVIFAAFGCGEPTDDPQDCTQNEYFDDAKQLCETCPAVEEPECRDGCGYTVTKDERSCPIAVCNDVCG
ncbi:MAG: hypothetical protein R3E66_08005 [bacterium]